MSNSVTPQTAACQNSLSFTIRGACSNSCPLSWRCHPTISSSVIPLSSCFQPFPASGSFSNAKSQLFTSGGQSIGASALPSVLPMDIQGWFPLGLTGLISLQSKGLQKVFYNTTVKKHQFIGIQPSLWSYLRSSHTSLLGSGSITGPPWENSCCNVSLIFFSFHNHILFIVF